MIPKTQVDFLLYFMLTWLCNALMQITGGTIGEVKAVVDMHQRKAEMARHLYAFIAFPGLYIINL